MNFKKNISHIINYIFTGFFLGFILSVIIYLIIFQISDTVFTFKQLERFHKISVFTYLIDILPICGIILAYRLWLRESRTKNRFDVLIKERQNNKEKAIDYLQQIESGKLTGLKVEDPDNELFRSLDKLKDTLIKNRDTETQRKYEDDQRNWVSAGLAMFSDILRQPDENMEEYAYLLISSLVKYLEANQGGFFIVETDSPDEKYFKMLACHAYDRRKFANKRIEWGSGLIGNCALEKKSVYLKDIPEDYLYITSGLGKATPNYLLIVPMISGEDVQGIIEIASFKRFEEYQINFVEKVAESIAVTVLGIKNNIRTTILLNETRAQAEALALQEAKLRQNMEELKVIQEKAAKQAEKFISFTNSVNHTLIRAEYDINGILIYANTKFLIKMGYSGNKEVEGKHIASFIHEKDKEWFSKLWERLSAGGEHFEGYMKHITKQAQDLWTMATYTCVRKEDGSVEKILFIAIDTTEYKKQSLDYESQLEAINKLSIKVEFSPDGKIHKWNNLLINTLEYPEEEIKNKTIYELIDTKDLETYNEIWEDIIRGNIYQGQIRLLTKFQQEKWFRAALSAIKDMYNEVTKVILIANEITNEKIMEFESRKLIEKLEVREKNLKEAEIKLENEKKEITSYHSDKLKAVSKNLFVTKDILDNTNDLIVSVDDSGKLIYLNHSAAEFWKKEDWEEKELSLMEVVHKDFKKYPEIFLNLINSSSSNNPGCQQIELTDHANKMHICKVKLIPGVINDKKTHTAIITRIS